MKKLYLLLMLLLLVAIKNEVNSQDNNSDTVDIYDLSLEELMNIKVVTSGKTEQKLSEAAATICVITSEQIQNSGYNSISELLEMVAGIYLNYDYYQPNLGIRGISEGMRSWSRTVKVMIDNQPVSFSPSGENWLGTELIPIDLVDRVEIVKGPASALYGANAFLGVINIITKNGRKFDGAYLSAKANIYNGNPGYGSEFIYGDESGKSNFIVGGQYNLIDRSGLTVKNIPDFEKYDETFLTKNDLEETYSVFGKYIYKSQNLGNLGFDFNYQRFKKNGEFQDWAVLKEKNILSLYNYYSRIFHEKSFHDKSFLTTSFSIDKGEPTKDENLVLSDEGIADKVIREVGYFGFDATTELKYFLKKKTNISLGFDFSSKNHNLQTFYYEWEGQTETHSTGEVLGDTTFNNTGIYLQSIINPFEFSNSSILQGLEFTLGIRYDIHNIYGNDINYRVAGVYKFNENIYSKILYGTSFKAPASVQLYTTIMQPSGVIGNPNLKPEKASTYEFALGANFSKNVNLMVNVFFNEINNKVDLVKSNITTSNVMAENISSISSYGIEGQVNLKILSSLSYVNASYQKSLIETEDPLEGIIAQDTKLYPTLMIKSGTNIRIPKIYSNINIQGRWIDSRLSSVQNTYNFDPVDKTPYLLDSYLIFDATISSLDLKILKRDFVFSFSIKNLLNSEYLYPGFDDFDIPGQKRFFVLKISQYFL